MKNTLLATAIALSSIGVNAQTDEDSVGAYSIPTSRSVQRGWELLLLNPPAYSSQTLNEVVNLGRVPDQKEWEGGWDGHLWQSSGLCSSQSAHRDTRLWIEYPEEALKVILRNCDPAYHRYPRFNVTIKNRITGKFGVFSSKDGTTECQGDYDCETSIPLSSATGEIRHLATPGIPVQIIFTPLP